MSRVCAKVHFKRDIMSTCVVDTSIERRENGDHIQCFDSIFPTRNFWSHPRTTLIFRIPVLSIAVFLLWSIFVNLFVYVMLSCLFLSALLSPAGNGWYLGSPVFGVFFAFCHFSIWCPEPGVVIDYIDSQYLPSSLLYLTDLRIEKHIRLNWYNAHTYQQM